MKKLFLILTLIMAPMMLSAHKVILHVTHRAEVKIVILDRTYCADKLYTQGRSHEESTNEHPVTVEFYGEDGFFWRDKIDLSTFSISGRSSQAISSTRLTPIIEVSNVFTESDLVETTGEMFDQLYPGKGYINLTSGLVGGNMHISSFENLDINKKLYTANGFRCGFSIDPDKITKSQDYDPEDDEDLPFNRKIHAGEKDIFCRFSLSSKVTETINVPALLKLRFKKNVQDQQLYITLDYTPENGFTLTRAS